MRIQCLTTFLDSAERFEKDDIRTVDDDRAAHFCAQGWAVAPGGGDPAADPAAATTLNVQSATLNSGDSNG